MTRGGFTITVFQTTDELARAAASRVTSGLRQKQDLMIVAATGGSPTRTYEFLAGDQQKDPALFRGLRVHKLDEWGGLDADDPGSCEAYLQEHLLAPLQIDHAAMLPTRQLRPINRVRSMSQPMMADGGLANQLSEAGNRPLGVF
ncbi:MAG: galactosamine-6-phosphate isomerase [Verrucomicrobiales bacterium]|nr:galactosamine-6-phosphate isomerase [Verrucomicrobiales bacterium]